MLRGNFRSKKNGKSPIVVWGVKRLQYWVSNTPLFPPRVPYSEWNQHSLPPSFPVLPHRPQPGSVGCMEPYLIRKAEVATALHDIFPFAERGRLSRLLNSGTSESSSTSSSSSSSGGEVARSWGKLTTSCVTHVGTRRNHPTPPFSATCY